MNAGFIVGYVTQPNGNPISDAEIWFGASNETNAVNEAEEFGINVSRQPVVKTNSRGYFQLPIFCFGANISKIVGANGRLNIFVNSPNDAPVNSVSERFDKNFQVTGYLVKDAAGAAA